MFSVFQVVYVQRDPKDILVSLYHFSCSWDMIETPSSFDDFFKRFLNGDSKVFDSCYTQNPGSLLQSISAIKVNSAVYHSALSF